MRQRKHLFLGEGGCYFLSIICLGESLVVKEVDDIRMYDLALSKKWIEKDCYVWFPDKILSHITGKKFKVRHEKADYVPKAGEYVIERWEWKQTMKTLSHFKLPNYDPFGESETVKNGDLVSKRIFWEDYI